MSSPVLEAVICDIVGNSSSAAQRWYPALCQRAQGDGRPYGEFLHDPPEAEVTSRRQSAARRLLREARFRDVRTLDQVD
jgi:hypothetical protein